MDVNTLLTSDGDIEQLHNAVAHVQTTLQIASYDYAKAALSAANEALKAVQNAAPAGTIWPHIVEWQILSQKADRALNATMNATGMLLNSEETGDAVIDAMNMNTKIECVDAHVIQALLEGAQARAQLAMTCLPKGAKAGQRVDPSALTQKVQ